MLFVCHDYPKDQAHPRSLKCERYLSSNYADAHGASIITPIENSAEPTLFLWASLMQILELLCHCHTCLQFTMRCGRLNANLNTIL